MFLAVFMIAIFLILIDFTDFEILTDYINWYFTEFGIFTDFTDFTFPRHWNTELVSSGASLATWGEGASLVLVGDTCSDGVTIRMPDGVDVLHRSALHPIFSYWVG